MRPSRTDVRRRADLSQSDIDQMFTLYDRYYDGGSRELFRADLGDKDYVVVLYDESNTLRGFSTVAVLDLEYGAGQQRAIFSGDTIIDHRCWGSQALPLAWCQLAGELKASAPDIPLYWFLISKGYRTYRYLPLFAKQFYPSWKEATPAYEHGLLSHLAAQRFGAAFDAGSGVVRFPQSRGHLREQWASVRPLLRTRADVRFFLERNPGYAQGHELVCLTELRADNLRLHARRAFLAAANADGCLATSS